MTKAQITDIVERVISTFIMTFLPVWAASNFAISKVVFVSAASAGLSAVKNFVKQTV